MILNSLSVYNLRYYIKYRDACNPFYKKKGQTIRPSCTQAAVATRGERFLLLR